MQAISPNKKCQYRQRVTSYPDATDVPADLFDVDTAVKCHPAVSLEVPLGLGLGEGHPHEAGVSLAKLKVEGENECSIVIGSFYQVGARFVTVSIVTSVNVQSIILDYKCTFTVVLQIRMKSISPPSIENYNNVN